MAFERFYLTAKGAALLARAQIGTQLVFTKMVVGQGYVPQGVALTDMIAVLDPVTVLPIASLSVDTKGQANVSVQFDNRGLEPFYWSEIGLYAKDPDVGEILYGYGNAGSKEQADYIPAVLTEFAFNVILAVQNAQDVQAVIDKSLIYPTVSDMDQAFAVLRSELVPITNEQIDGCFLKW